MRWREHYQMKDPDFNTPPPTNLATDFYAQVFQWPKTHQRQSHPLIFRVRRPTLRVHLTSCALHKKVARIDDVPECSYYLGAIALAKHV